MDQFTKKRIAGLVWPRFSSNFDILNRNAQMLATIRRNTNRSICKCASRKEMYSAVNEALGGARISYLEFGVWKGESLGMWIEINTDAGSRFYGFDSFEGLPEVWNHGFGHSTGKQDFDVCGEMPVFPDPRVHCIKGWFQRTLRGFLSEHELSHPIVVHIDSDLHSSALYVLSTLDPLFEAGDAVMFDEYASPSNEYLAWEEYKGAFMRTANCVAITKGWSQAAFVLA